MSWMRILVGGLAAAGVLLAEARPMLAQPQQCEGCLCIGVTEIRPCTCGEDGEAGIPPEENFRACWLDGELPPDACQFCLALPEVLLSPCDGPPGGSCTETVRRYKALAGDGRCDVFCPPTEAGQCGDGVNNDAWLDDAGDCLDPDCRGDRACAAATPALSPLGLATAVLILFAIAAYSMRRRRTAR